MKNKEIDRQNIEKLLKGSRTILLATDNGIGVSGDLSHILTAYSFLTEKLIDGGVPKRYLKLAFNMVNEKKDKAKLNEKSKKELKDLLKEISEALSESLSKDLEELLGEDDE